MAAPRTTVTAQGRIRNDHQSPPICPRHGLGCAMHATMAGTSRIIDVLVAKDVLTRKEPAVSFFDRDRT
jgi:hypothetical protein